MKVKKITENGFLDEAVEMLRNGGVVAFPTETSYGLACDMTNERAVEKIYRIKGRPMDKPLPAIVASIAMAEEYVDFTDRARELAKRHWPGALTMVLPVRSKIKKGKRKIEDAANIPSSFFLLPSQSSVALRVSSHPIAQALVKGLGRPLSATSANISGEGNVYDPAELAAQFNNRPDQPDLVIDAGVLQPVPPSTIIEVSKDQVRVLRQGNIRVE